MCQEKRENTCNMVDNQNKSLQSQNPLIWMAGGFEICIKPLRIESPRPKWIFGSCNLEPMRPSNNAMLPALFSDLKVEFKIKAVTVSLPLLH
jgi:hypothetical protein